MFISKLKIVLACAAVIVGGVWAASAAIAPADPVDPAAPPVQGKISSKAKVYGPIEIKLIANQSRYEFNLGGEAPKAFRALLEDPQSIKPKPPAIDAVLELKNISDKPVRFWMGGDPVNITLQLAGPDALTVPSRLQFTADFRLPGAKVLEAGQTHRYELRSLASGFRGSSLYGYWLSPGDYQLSAVFHTALSPKLENSPDDGDGFGKCALTTEPVTLKVVAGPGGKLERPQVPPRRQGIGDTGRGGQGGGFVPGQPPVVQPDTPK